MSLTTPNLNLPYIAPAQAQKHVTHNEAIRTLDALVQLSVLAVQDNPPEMPQNGMRYIIGLLPIGVFEGRANQLAVFQDGAWAFFMPQIGWQAYDQNQSSLLIFKGDIWTEALSDGQDSFEMTQRLGINGQADDVNRLLLHSEASLFNHDGSGHQLKINKANETDTASLLYQSGFAGHAEMGLTGDNDFSVNVSSNGAQFLKAMHIDKATADVRFDHGIGRDKLLPTMPNAGGGEEFFGFPNLSTIPVSQSNLTLVENRVYFSAIWVDRQTEITGGLVVVTSSPSGSEGLMRLGIFEIGKPSANKWKLGARRADFGSRPLTDKGAIDFTAQDSVILERGWYMFALGVNRPGVVIRYVQNHTSGLCQFSVHVNASSASYRAVGPSVYCFLNHREDDILTGFPEDITVPITAVPSTGFRSFAFCMPKFKHWNAPS